MEIIPIGPPACDSVSDMRWLALCTTLLLTVTACVVGQTGGGEGSTAATTTTGVTTTTTIPTTTTTSTAPTTTTTLPPPPPLALITDTGVTVPVRSATPAGFIVTTPCGNTGYTTGGTPITEVRVVLDPGHGGPIDTGAVGRNGLAEKDLNLQVAAQARDLLEERGIPTMLTRSGDYAVPLPVRPAMADGVDAEVLVSIHHNAPTPQASQVPGTEIFIQTGSEESRRLGGVLYDTVVEALSQFDIPWHAAPDAGVLIVHNRQGRDTYGMVFLPETVAVLAEFAYLSSPEEAALMATTEYVMTAATALADALETYLTTDEPGSGFVEEPRVFTAQAAVSAALCEEVALR